MQLAESIDIDTESGRNGGAAENETVLIPSKHSLDSGRSRKRKRREEDDRLEDSYLERLERNDQTHVASSREEHRHVAEATPVGKASEDRGSGSESASESEGEDFKIPQHETVAPKDDGKDLEQANRTVFLGNVSTAAIKSKTSRRELLSHLISFAADVPQGDQPHKVESIRFRSTAFTTSAMPKKAAFVKGELMDATTQSTNAYAVYNSALCAREAVKRLNGTVVLGRHLRVDGVAHPSPVDHRRCVFVGNLDFVDDDSLMKAADDVDGRPSKRKKAKPNGDVEEGLWRQFKTAGEVEGVRVVRDKSTRVGKGFAYVQFKVRGRCHVLPTPF